MSRSLWRPPLAWAAAIFVGTSIPGDRLAHLPLGVDKLIHFALYAVLGLLVARALRGARTTWRTTLAALAALAAFAALDELHQAFVPGRSTDAIDWLADVIGSVAGLFARAPSTLGSEQRT